MSFDVHSLEGYSTIASVSGTNPNLTIVVQTGDGSKFGNPQNVTIWPVGVQPTRSNSTIGRISAISTDTLTVTTAQEGSSNISVITGMQIANTVTPKVLTDIENNLGTGTLVENETPGGSINGSNTSFTTASVFNSGSLRVYLNGQRLTSGSSNDYVETTQGFTMEYAPITGDVLRVDYNITNSAFIQGSNSIVVNETPTGSINGSNMVFTTLLGKYVSNTTEVTLNGLVQLRGTDYTETTPGSGIFTFTTAPVTGDAVRVNYQYSTGAAGNAQTVNGIQASTTATANELYPLNSNAGFPLSIIDNTTGAWTSWTPTWTNCPVSNSTVNAKYLQIGKIVFYEISVVFAGGDKPSGSVKFSFPVNSVSYPGTANTQPVGQAQYFITNIYDGYVVWTSTTTATLVERTVSGTVLQYQTISGTAPATFTNGSEMHIQGFYQAA